MLFGCYPKEMALNQEDWHKILVALSNGDEKKIFKVLSEKKVIDDKSPKLRTEDEKKMLKSLSYQMSKFPQKLIEGIQKKFPFLQGTPKTPEQRKEQKKECNKHYMTLPAAPYTIHHTIQKDTNIMFNMDLLTYSRIVTRLHLHHIQF